jgi:hypothetical protein
MATLADIDAEISRLFAKRDEMTEMLKRGKMVSDLLFKASTFQDQSITLLYAKGYLLPWRHYLSDTLFPNFTRALPRDLPQAWTQAEASQFLLMLSKALERDRMTLEF